MTEIFKVLMIFYLCAHSDMSSAVERVKLTSGEIHSLELNKNQSISLSRKGVVEVLGDMSNVVQFLAVRKGLVVITVRNQYDEIDDQIIIQVNGKESITKDHKLFSSDSRWYHFICKQSQIDCDSERYVIKGISDKPKIFYQSKHYCYQHQPCSFVVTLSSAAKQQVEKYFSSIEIPDSWLKVGDDGSLFFQAYCRSSQAKSLEKLLVYFNIPDHMLHKTCIADDNMFEIKLDLITTTRKQASYLKPLFDEQLLTPSSADLLNRIDRKKSKQEVKVIGSPIFFLPMGQKVSMSNGLFTHQEDYLRKENVSVSVDAEIKDFVNDKIFVWLKLGLTKPGDSYRYAYSSQFEGTLWIPLNQSTVVSKFMTSSEQNNEKVRSLLSRIPIISPLFSNKQSNSGEVEMILKASVRLLNSSKPMKPR